MRRPRVSLLGLMGAIAVLAAFFAALRLPYLPVRLSALFTLWAFLLLTATVAAIVTRGASWVGFAVFGWGCSILSFVSLALGEWHSSAEPIRIPVPIVSMWIMEFHSSVMGYRPNGRAVMFPNLKGGHSLVAYQMVQLYHLGFSLLAACFGGLVARFFGGPRPSVVDPILRPPDPMG